MLLLLLATVIGALAAVGVLLFEQLIHAVEWATHRWNAAEWTGTDSALRVIAPIVGGLVVGIILHHAGVPEKHGHAVTEVIEAATLDDEEFPYHQVPAKASVAALSLGSGASLGPEDPAIEIGGGIANALAVRWHLTHGEVRQFLAAGAAGGLAAGFGAPIGAAVFTIEVFAVRVLSRTALYVAAASATAFVVTDLIDSTPPFRVPPFTAAADLSLVVALVIGVVAGVVAALQVRLVYFAEHRFLELRVPRWTKPAIGGALLGGAAILLPQILGIGYDTVEAVLGGELRTVYLLLLLLVAKMLFMAISFGSGFLGGMFAPSFFIGVMLGALVALGVAAVPITAGTTPAAFALVGMAAFTGALVHAPFTAVLIMRAIAGGWELLPLLLVACLVSHAVATRIEHRSVYTYALKSSERVWHGSE